MMRRVVPIRAWWSAARAFVRHHAARMREPYYWPPASAHDPTGPSDREGNFTARSRHQIKPLRAADESGREWIILQIVPVEPVQGYNNLRYVEGAPRYELKDGTPVVQRSDSVFEVGDTTLRIQS